MNFFNGIKNFIKTEVLGIKDVKSVTQDKDCVDKPNSLMEVSTDTPEDRFESQSTLKQAELDASTQNMSMKAMESTLENIPTKNFDIRKMIKNGLIEKITGITTEKFNQLTPKQKNLVIMTVKYSVAKFDNMKESGIISKDASEEELISEFGKILYDAILNGSFRNTQEFEDAVGDISQDLGTDFTKCSNKEQRNRLKNNRIELDREMQKELDSISNLTGDERVNAEQKIHDKYNYIRRGRFIDVNAKYSSEAAMNSIVLLNSKDLEYGAKVVLGTRCDQAEQTKVADYANYGFTKGLIEDYKELNDNIQPQSLQGYTQTITQYKSTDGIMEYHQQYNSDRMGYERALQKQRNGEHLTTEEQHLLATMNPNYYTATAKGIGQGALSNVNMTIDEKAEFLLVWSKDAEQYSDYSEVTSDVLSEISDNPKYQGLQEKIQRLEQIDTNKKVVLKKDSEPKYTNEQTFNNTFGKEFNNRFVSSPKEFQTRDTNLQSSTKNQCEDNTTFKELNINPSIVQDPTVIVANIKQEGIKKTISKYGDNVVELILENTGLKHLRPELITVIRAYDLKTLKDMSMSCSDSAFIFICNVVNKDFVPKMKEVRDNTKSLSYVAEKQLEMIEGD